MAFAQLASVDSMPLPEYYIYREGEPFDPTAKMVFVPAKGTDELFDALRIAFPTLNTHSERMREAVIQFLITERDTEQALALHTSPAMTMDSNWPASSLLSSPETNNLSTPASYAPSPQPAHLTRQASSATSVSQPSPPALDQMTSVFSLSTTQQPKQRVRRKMTETEKVEYRKRRIVKACDKCAKRKRKCPHNQAQMETLASTGKPNSRVSKSNSPKSSTSLTTAQHAQQTAFDPAVLSAEDIDLGEAFDFHQFMPTEDFALFQDQDPFMGLNMDNFAPYDNFDPTKNYQTGSLFTPELSPMQLDWQYGDFQNAAQFDPSLSNHTQFDQAAWDSQSSSSPELQSISGSRRQYLPQQSDRTPQIDMSSSLDSLSSATSHHPQQHGGLEDSQLFDGFEGENGSRWNVQQNGAATDRLESAQSLNREQIGIGRFKKRRVGESGGSGEDRFLDHVPTGQSEKPVPTHTSHVHEAQSRQLSALDEGTIIPQNISKQRTQQQTLPGMLESVSDAHSDRATVQQRQGSQQGAEHSQRNVSVEQTTLQPEDHQRGSRISTLQHERGAQSSMRVPADLQQPASQLVQDLTSTSVSVSGGLTSAALQQGRPLSSLDERSVAQQAAKPNHQTRPRNLEQSLGKGLPQDADASTQLYMARKRALGGLLGNSRLQTRTTSNVSRLQQEQHISTNGGAYPRLGDLPLSSPILVAATRAETANATNAGGLTVPNSADSNDAAQDGLSDHHGSQDVYQDRLRDTRRFKDHHGRVPLSSSLLVMLCCALLLVASLLSNSVSSTALLLALFTPCHATPSQQTSSPVQKIVHCTTKNSRWLSSAFASLTETKYGLAVPSREKQGWYFPGTEGSWLKGLLDPYVSAYC